MNTPYPYKISVVDASGNPVANTSISLSSGETHQKVTGMTDANGHAVLDAGSFDSHDTGDVLYLEVGTPANYEGIKLAKKIGREIKYLIKHNWRGSDYIGELVNPIPIASHPLPIDENLGMMRYVLEFSFAGMNIGEKPN